MDEKYKAQLEKLQGRCDVIRAEIADLDLTEADARETYDRLEAEETSLEKAMVSLRERGEREVQQRERTDRLMAETERDEHTAKGSGYITSMYDWMCGRQLTPDAEKANITRHGKQEAFLVNRDQYIHGMVAEEVRTMMGDYAQRELLTSATPGSNAIGELMAQMISDRKDLRVGVRAGSARVVRTQSGNRIPFPTANDTGNTGAVVAEGTTISDSSVDPSMAVVNMDAYDHSSSILRVSMQFLDDLVQQDAVAWIWNALTGRVERRENVNFTTGDGSSKPRGLTVAGTSAVTASSATAVTADEVLELMHSVDAAYATVESAEWHYNWATAGEIKTIARVSLSNRHGTSIQYEPGALGMPARLEGHRVVINPDMPGMTTGNDAIAFGDMSQYVIREVANSYLIRFDELFARDREVGFLLVRRVDGDLLHGPAVRHITMG